MRDRWDLYQTVGWMALTILVVGGALVLVTGSNPGNCGKDPGCLLGSEGQGGVLHEGVAGILLVAILTFVILAYRSRRDRPERLLPSGVALLCVLGTALWGAGLAAGLLPLSTAPVILLGLLGTAGGILWGIQRTSPPGNDPGER